MFLFLVFVVAAAKSLGPGLHYLGGLEGRVGCLGDFNGDRLTDVLIIDSLQKSVQVHLYTGFVSLAVSQSHSMTHYC